MAGARQSKATNRRNREARDAATQERVTLIAVGVLAAVAIIAAVGVVWSVVLPPRAHLLTVGDVSYNARTVAEVSEFLLTGGAPPTDDPVAAVVDQIKRDETLLQVGAAEVGEISPEDMDAALRERLGAADDLSAEDFAKAYATFLQGTSVDQPTYERLVQSQVIADRLAQRFAPEIGDAGLQLHLLGITSRDENRLRQFREAVVGGADFAATAVSMGLASSAEQVDLGWQLPPVTGPLYEQAHVEDLPEGEVTEVLERPGAFQYDIYRLVERDDQRAYTDDQKQALSEQRVNDWVAEHAGEVTVTEDISSRERNWVLREVARAAVEIAARRNAAAGVTGLPPGVGVTVNQSGEQPGSN